MNNIMELYNGFRKEAQEQKKKKSEQSHWDKYKKYYLGGLGLAAARAGIDIAAIDKIGVGESGLWPSWTAAIGDHFKYYLNPLASIKRNGLLQYLSSLTGISQIKKILDKDYDY